MSRVVGDAEQIRKAQEAVARQGQALQAEVLAALSDSPQTADQVAAAAGVPDAVESVFPIPEHLAANGRASRRRGSIRWHDIPQWRERRPVTRRSAFGSASGPGANVRSIRAVQLTNPNATDCSPNSQKYPCAIPFE